MRKLGCNIIFIQSKYVRNMGERFYEILIRKRPQNCQNAENSSAENKVLIPIWILLKYTVTFRLKVERRQRKD